MNDFEVGDVVVLKSGSPKMTVEYCLGHVVNLVYFDDNYQVNRPIFVGHLLKKVDVS